jgi:hypothetical protein
VDNSRETIVLTPSRSKQLMDYLMPLGFIALYFILQLWVLPMFGVQT